MSLLKALRARVRALVRRSAADCELGDEIRFHLEQEAEKNRRRGMSDDEARRLAVAHFGGVERVREEHRDIRRAPLLEDFFADVRFALRTLRRTPALAGAAILTLGFGIGANVAIFSAVNAVVLRPLPFPAQDRLMVVTEENAEKHWHLELAAPANMLDWRAGVSDFVDVMGYTNGLGRATLTGFGDPRILKVSSVTGNFFSTLGVRAALGRTLADEESWANGTHVVVLSDRAWRDHFGADPSIVGKSISLNGQSRRVVGVMPPSFAFPQEGVDLWRPVEWDRAARGDASFRRAHWLRAVARLAPGATEAHADAQLQAVVDRLRREHPETNKTMGAAMMPLHDFLIGDTRLPLLVLLASVVFLLLIACANVGNLLLVQAAGREREMALRLALGAGRSRLVRQTLAESLVLAVAGGALGLAVGWAGTHMLVHLQPRDMLPVHDFGVDRPVLAYVLAVTVACALIFGVAPALWARHRSPADSLNDGRGGVGQTGRGKRWGDLLVISEVALALLMTVGAGLLVRSFYQMQRVDPGFDPHGVLVAVINAGASYDTVTKVEALMNEVETRARAIPGVTSAALASNVPFNGTSYTADFVVYGWPAGRYATEIGNRTVSPSYFTTMKVPLLRGRTFSPGDRRGSTPVIIINSMLAEQYFKGEDPIGQRIAFDKVPTAATIWYTIIGIAASEHVDALDIAPRIEALHSSAQEPSGYNMLLLRTNGDPGALAAPVRALLRDIDPGLAALAVDTMDSLRALSLARARFLTTLLLAFAAIGLALSIVGVYGVLAQVTRNRTREMGIRIALGAPTSAVRWLVVRHGLRLTIVGLTVGAVVALFTTRVMASLLFNVAPRDPTTLVSVALLLAATSVVAAWLPARNASHADPMTALRAD